MTFYIGYETLIGVVSFRMANRVDQCCIYEISVPREVNSLHSLSCTCSIAKIIGANLEGCIRISFGNISGFHERLWLSVRTYTVGQGQCICPKLNAACMCQIITLYLLSLCACIIWGKR